MVRPLRLIDWPDTPLALTNAPLTLAVEISETWPSCTLMAWPTFEPIWNDSWPTDPFSTLVPLKLVWLAIRVISDRYCCTEVSIAARSEAWYVPLADCTARSRMDCRLEVIWLSAEPAVCARLIASLALVLACPRPPICVWKREAIAKPAALSAALLIFRPEDRSRVAVLNALPDLLKLFWACSEAMLVFRTSDMDVS